MCAHYLPLCAGCTFTRTAKCQLGRPNVRSKQTLSDTLGVARRLLHSCDLTTLSLSGIVWRMRTDLQKLNTNSTTTQPRQQDHRRDGDRSQETHKHTQLSCRRLGSPTSMNYRFGERARITMRSQNKYARSQGTPSPQISVTLGNFNYQPIIRHRGPRPRAHWYMCADVANPRIVTDTIGGFSAPLGLTAGAGRDTSCKSASFMF